MAQPHNRGGVLIMAITEFLPLMVAIPLLAYMAASDLRHMRIPDFIWISFCLIFLALVAVPEPVGETLARIGIAAVVFVLGFIAFARRMVGGGDVKSLSALMLLVPTSALALFMLVFAASLIVGVAAVVSARHVAANPQSAWVFLRARSFPMGISIASAGLLLPIVARLYG